MEVLWNKMVKKMEKPKEVKEVDKKVFSFFVLAFPTILIVIFSMLSPSLWWANIFLAIYQLIMLKQFLDNYYP